MELLFFLNIKKKFKSNPSLYPLSKQQQSKVSK